MNSIIKIFTNNGEHSITTFESRILIGTSLITIIPIYYAFSKNLTFHGLITIGNCFFSILYWHNPVHGWRRNLDLIYAKLSFVVYFLSGIYYIPNGFPMLLFIYKSFMIVLFYSMTYVFPDIWLQFHICFHLMSILTKVYILSYVC